MNLFDIIRKAKKRDSRAESLLYEIFKESMLRTCYRYLKNTCQAEEAMLSGFMIFFQKIKEFEYTDNAALKIWLRQIMGRVCQRLMREQNTLHVVAEWEGEEITVPPDAFSNLTVSEMMDLILQLPDGYRTVLNLHIDGYSHAEIAQMLNIDIGTSHSQLNKARTYLMKLLNQNENLKSTGNGQSI